MKVELAKTLTPFQIYLIELLEEILKEIRGYNATEI